MENFQEIRKPLIKGDKILFSNHLDKSVLDTPEACIEEDIGSEGEENDDEGVQLDEEGFDHHQGVTERINKDIICFSIHKPTGILGNKNNDKLKSPRREMFTTSIPYVSPATRDIFSFFSSEESRMSFLEEMDDIAGDVEEEEEEEREEDEREELDSLDREESRDIFVFSCNDKISQTEGLMEKKKKKAEEGQRKTFIFTDNNGIISFYGSEESYIEAIYQSNSTTSLIMDNEEEDNKDEDEDREAEAEEIKDGPDIHIFSNKPRCEKADIESKKLTLVKGVDGGRKTFLCTNKHGIFSFYSNEDSFNEANNEVSDEESDEDSLDMSNVLENEDAIVETIQKDIHVFSNDPIKPPVCSTKWKAVELSNEPVMVVTNEFPDVISFYNPSPTSTKPSPCQANTFYRDSTLRATSTPVKPTCISPLIPPPPELQDEDFPLPPQEAELPCDVTMFTDDVIPFENKADDEDDVKMKLMNVVKCIEEQIDHIVDELHLDDYEDDENLEIEKELEEALSGQKASSRASVEMTDGELAIEDIDNLNDIELAIDMVNLDLTGEDAEGKYEGGEEDYPQDEEDIEFEVETGMSLEEELRKSEEYEDDFEPDNDGIFGGFGFGNLDSQIRTSLQKHRISSDGIQDVEPRRKQPDNDGIFGGFGFGDLESQIRTSMQKHRISSDGIQDVEPRRKQWEKGGNTRTVHDILKDSIEIEKLALGRLSPKPEEQPGVVEQEQDWDMDSDTEYKTLHEALNKPVLPPIQKIIEILRPIVPRDIKFFDETQPDPIIVGSEAQRETTAAEESPEIPQKPGKSGLVRQSSLDKVKPAGSSIKNISNELEKKFTESKEGKIKGRKHYKRQLPEPSDSVTMTTPSVSLIKQTKEKLHSLRKRSRSPIKKVVQQRKGRNLWRPVECIAVEVISCHDLNPMDANITIPRIEDRRTPIAKLFKEPPRSTSFKPIDVPHRSLQTTGHIPHDYNFITASTPQRKLQPSPLIRRKMAIFERVDNTSHHRTVSPGPESRYLSNIELNTEPRPECECTSHENNARKRSSSDEGGFSNGSLIPVGQRKNVPMFTPSWRKEEERPRSASPSWRSFSEAAFGSTGEIGTIRGYLAPNSSPRYRHLSYDCDRSSKLTSSAGSQCTPPTNVNRLARSGSAASLAVVMASTFPNGGDPDFDLEGTAAKISEVCNTVNSTNQSQEDDQGVTLKKSRSHNSCLDSCHAANVSRAPPIHLTFEHREIKMRKSRDKKISPMKLLLTYRQIKELQEKLSHERIVSYQDLITCPRNRLPKHIDKAALQNYLSDKEFWDIFRIDRYGFNELPEWKKIKMKKEVLLF